MQAAIIHDQLTIDHWSLTVVAKTDDVGGVIVAKMLGIQLLNRRVVRDANADFSLFARG